MSPNENPYLEPPSTSHSSRTQNPWTLSTKCNNIFPEFIIIFSRVYFFFIEFFISRAVGCIPGSLLSAAGDTRMIKLSSANFVLHQKHKLKSVQCPLMPTFPISPHELSSQLRIKKCALKIMDKRDDAIYRAKRSGFLK